MNGNGVQKIAILFLLINEIFSENIVISKWDWVKHGWKGDWKQDPENKHIGILYLTHTLNFFGAYFSLFTLDVEAIQIGPALVHLNFKTLLGNACMIQAITPVEPLQQQITHTLYSERFIPTWLGKSLLRSESIQIERDLMIWNHKTYIPKPLLVKEDHLIAKHRRWYSQFYSENSPRLTLRKDTMDF